MPDVSVSAEDFKVKDISLAGWGRQEIEMAQDEMPGLMALREEFGGEQILKGARISSRRRTMRRRRSRPPGFRFLPGRA